MIQEYTDKQKAIDYANWLNFIHRNKEQSFYVIEHDNGNYLVCSEETPNTDTSNHIPLEGSYEDMEYEDIKNICKDIDPLKHWENLCGAISTIDGELLRFILAEQIPLTKFIQYELGCRGCDDKGEWIGFEKSEAFWQK